MTPLPTFSQRTGQMIISGIEGTELTSETERFIRDCNLGGVILFPRNYVNPDQLFQFSRDLQALAEDMAPGWPLFISVDQEGGKVARLTEPFTRFPEPGCLGIADSEELAYRFGAALGQELASVGINMDYAPVLDVNTNPDNPIIGMRALSRDPVRAGELGVALMRGLQDQNVIAVGKHFPGHGDTTQDSHLELPYVMRDKKTLEDVELLPFRSAIQNGLKAMMTAHVVYPSLDAEIPATFSSGILNGLLRDKMKYDQLLISDDLEMKAIDHHMPFETLAERGVAAGLDIFLICHNTDRVKQLHATLTEAVERGQIPETAIDQSVERIGRVKGSLAPLPITCPDPEVWREAHKTLAEEMSAFLSV